MPTKKGHQILYKGYTYVLKTPQPYGSEHWCCSYRQKTSCISAISVQTTGIEVVRDFHNHKKPIFTEYETPDKPPEWVFIYYVKTNEQEYRCNICEAIIQTSEKTPELLAHLQMSHKDVYELHKENPEASVGFRIEFLHLNVLKDDAEQKNQPVIIGEMCEATTEEIVQHTTEKQGSEDQQLYKYDTDQQIVLVTKQKKPRKSMADRLENRKRSWVWKYFHRMSNIIFRCTLCNVVLSIKACNTNNLNRHVRTRHPAIYRAEAMKKRSSSTEQVETIEYTEVETPVAVKTEEISSCEKDFEDPFETSTLQRQRRSWIWLYFNRISATSAQCKLCNRNICHGGNATGNMNRHLKMIHQKTGGDHTWIWKVFESSEEDFYICKICNYQVIKFSDLEKSVNCILNHLKTEHGVFSGDQIITGSEECDEDVN